MIENKNEASKNLEKALQALEQAKQRVATEKKKQNEKKRKAENHHKYIMGGIIVKYFPDCCRYDEGGLNVSCRLHYRQGSVSRLSLKSSQKAEIQSLQSEYDSIGKEQTKTATELAYAEVISYNKKNLERELQIESR